MNAAVAASPRDAQVEQDATTTGGADTTTTTDTSSGTTTTTDPDTDGPLGACKVPADDDDAPPACEVKAPADAFVPQIQWSWQAPAPEPASIFSGSFATPLVGNFTDDNGDGAIDLCDTPDVLVTAVTSVLADGRGEVHMLAGDTGAPELVFPVEVDAFVYPAFGDIDGDGLPELVAADTGGHLMAFAHDGAVEWTSPVVGGYRTTFASASCTTIGIYDLDGDGAPEILFGWEVYDNAGALLFGDPTNAAEFDTQYWCVTPTAADLDGDGQLEVVMGHEAYRADGSLYYKLNGFKPAHPHIANLDGDPEPEIFLTNADGISLLDHTGELLFGPVRPTDPNRSAEILVVHNYPGGVRGVTLTTLRDAEDRWIPARRIWNQYSYHVTNVREDGTIPAKPKNSWQLLNTYRTNSQVEKGGLCEPIP